jgi:hypothetical protein
MTEKTHGKPAGAASTNNRDDADARGEHVYGTRHTSRPATGPTGVEGRQGDYVAGADGTQHVSPPSGATASGEPPSSPLH